MGVRADAACARTCSRPRRRSRAACRSAPCVAGGEAADVLQPGDHGATFGGGPLVAAAALATLDVLDDDALLARVRVLGDRLRVGLEGLRAAGRLTDVRGRGLMVGADLPPSRTAGAGGRARRRSSSGIVLNATGPATLRFLPPLVDRRGATWTACSSSWRRRCERRERAAGAR